MSELLPLFPLSTVLFPGMRLPLHVFEDRYRQLVADLQALPEPRRFGVIAIRTGREVGADGVTALHEIGCVAAIRQITAHADGRFDLAAVGTQRFRLLSLDQTGEYFQGEVEMLPDAAVLTDEVVVTDEAALSEEPVTSEETVLTNETGVLDASAVAAGAAEATALAVVRAQAGFRTYLNALADRGGGVISIADLPDEPVLLSYVIGAAMIIDLPERQSLLAAPDALRRLRLERSLLTRESGILRATTTRPAPDYTYGRFSPN